MRASVQLLTPASPANVLTAATTRRAANLSPVVHTARALCYMHPWMHAAARSTTIRPVTDGASTAPAVVDKSEAIAGTHQRRDSHTSARETSTRARLSHRSSLGRSSSQRDSVDSKKHRRSRERHLGDDKEHRLDRERRRIPDDRRRDSDVRHRGPPSPPRRRTSARSPVDHRHDQRSPPRSKHNRGLIERDRHRPRHSNSPSQHVRRVVRDTAVEGASTSPQDTSRTSPTLRHASPPSHTRRSQSPEQRRRHSSTPPPPSTTAHRLHDPSATVPSREAASKKAERKPIQAPSHASSKKESPAKAHPVPSFKSETLGVPMRGKSEAEMTHYVWQQLRIALLQVISISFSTLFNIPFGFVLMSITHIVHCILY